MNKWAARFALADARRSGRLPNVWARFEAMNTAAHEVRRALWGIDKATAYCGDRNARLRRYIVFCRQFDCPKLP